MFNYMHDHWECWLRMTCTMSVAMVILRKIGRYKNLRMSYSVFCQKLSQQMLGYDPSELKYEGDQVARVNTQVNKKRKSLKLETETVK